MFPVGVNYCQPAVGLFSWNNHPHKTRVEGIWLTVAPNFSALKLNDQIIKIQIKGYPSVSLSNTEKVVSDYRNQGPYIDYLAISILPRNIEASEGKMECVDDTIGGTRIRELQTTAEESNSISVNMNPQGSVQSYGNGITNSAGGGFTHSSRIATQTAYGEFEPIFNLYDVNRTVRLKMKKCYAGLFSREYDTSDMNSLKCSRHDERLGYSAGIPLFGLISLATCHDWLYSPPDCAKSSISMDWQIEYALDGIQRIAFDWITEVRTVFASNAGGVPEWGSFYSCLNWIQTIHQVKKTIELEINESNVIKSTSVETETKVLSSEGIGSKTYDDRMIRINQESFTPCNQDQLREFISLI